MVSSPRVGFVGGVAAGLIAWCGAPAGAAAAVLRFSDDFEKGDSRWEIHGGDGVFVADSGDPAHGRVLVLRPQGDVLALIPGSERWGAVAIEGDVRFPDPESSHLGVAYNANRNGDRLDFGLVYIRGDASFLMPGPQRDFNSGHRLYGEYRVPLEGDAAIRPGEWQRFRIEVVGSVVHAYVGPGTTPQLTFPHFELSSGAVGLQPRPAGGDVWVDNVAVSSIERFSYLGPPRPEAFQYDPEALLTQWQVAGPTMRTDDALARDPAGQPDTWRRFDTDARGAVVTARVVDYHGPNTVAYFRTQIVTDEGGRATLSFSTIDDLALWVNGRFLGVIPRADYAWYDFWRNPAHEGQHIPIQLATGTNEIVIRVRGGAFASGGFYAWIERRR